MIKLLGIEKIYNSSSGKVHALKGIDLEIACGEISGILFGALYRYLKK